MNRHSKWTRILIVVSSLILMLGVSHAIDASKEDREAFEREQRIAPLIRLNIDINSPDALIKALSNDDVGVQLSAIFLLRGKKEEKAIPQIRALLGSEYDHMRFVACEALVALQDDTHIWRLMCIGLLQSDDLITQIRSARLLAENKDPQGWPIVEKYLTDKDVTLVLEASVAAPIFQNQDWQGKKVPVVNTAINAFKKGDGLSQVFLLNLLSTVIQANDIDALRLIRSDAKTDQILQVLNDVIRRIEKNSVVGFKKSSGVGFK